MSEIEPNFSDEVMLAGWSETHNGGAKVTFWLNDSQALDAFKSLTVAKGKTAGQRFMMVLVEIDDNEQPKASPKVAVEKGGAGSVWLALRCKEPEFWNFIIEKYHIDFGIENEAQCDNWVKYFGQFESKKDVDLMPEKKEWFDKEIRLPYSQWLLGKR